jgi:hypothetical protein
VVEGHPCVSLRRRLVEPNINTLFSLLHHLSLENSLTTISQNGDVQTTPTTGFLEFCQLEVAIDGYRVVYYVLASAFGVLGGFWTSGDSSIVI